MKTAVTRAIFLKEKNKEREREMDGGGEEANEQCCHSFYLSVPIMPSIYMVHRDTACILQHSNCSNVHMLKHPENNLCDD